MRSAAPPAPVLEGRNASALIPIKQLTWRRIVLLVCVLAVLAFYVRCGLTYGKVLRPAEYRGGFQNLQADAFLAGQLDLRLDVPAGLAELDDPYDATANEPYRAAGLHDLTFYDGKLYAYFGPAPVVLLYIPARLLQLGELSSTFAVLVFCSGGFLASVGVLRTMVRRFLAPLSTATEAVSILALGLAAPMGWLVHIGRAYEVPIACGYCLVFSGLFFLTRGLFTSTTRPNANLMLGSLLLAGAVGARPNLFWLFGFIVFALAYLRWGALRGPIPRRAWSALLGPYVLVGLALAWYNWARFGSVSEFGTNYMMLGENIRLARADEFEFLRRGLFEYLISPARTRPGFPGISLRPMSFPLPTESNYIKEPVAGLLPNMPACLVGLLGLVGVAVMPHARRRQQRWLPLFVALLAGIALVVVAISSFHFHSVTMRYQVDYAPMLLLASVLGWIMFMQALRAGWVRRMAQTAAVFVVAWSAFFSIAITTYPCAGTGSC
jgi:hypothetical protein